MNTMPLVRKLILLLNIKVFSLEFCMFPKLSEEHFLLLLVSEKKTLSVEVTLTVVVAFNVALRLPDI